MKKLSIIIPVYNEKNTIGEVLRRVEGVSLNGIEKEIILVDDFSTDGTKEVLNGLNSGYKVFFHDENMGKGAAVRKGFKEATGDIVLIQDADLEYDPNDYPKLIQPLIKGQANVVYGSRFLDKSLGNSIVYRHGYIFAKILNWLSNFLSGQKLTDMYTGYKIFSKEAIGKITPAIKSKRFGIDPELTALAARNKFSILEVPIRYQGRTYKEGKKINWKDGIAAIFHIIRFNLFQ